MRSFFLAITILVLSCQTKKEQKAVEDQPQEVTKTVTPYIKSIDSDFFDGLKKPPETIELQLEPLYATINNESTFSTVKGWAKYHVIDSYDVDENVQATLICTDFDDDNLDGRLQLAFIVTMKDGKQSEILRVGKVESASDYMASEFSEITNSRIEKILDFSGIEQDTTWTEIYKIDSQGRINLE